MKKDRERASITVEAALFLPLFLMAFLTIYNLVYFARAQMLMQYAADQAVKQVAQYSYILEKTGILDSLDNMTTKNEKFEQDMDSIRKNLETIQSATEKAVQGTDVIDNINQIGDEGEKLVDKAKGYVENPSEFINGVLLAMKKDAVNGVASYMVNTVAKSCVEQQLSIAGGSHSAEEYMQILGITNVSMKKTAWCQNKSRDIRLVVDFDLNSRMPFFVMAPRHYRVCASTRVWSGV